LDKKLNKKDKYLNFINIGNDGHSLNVRRSEIKGSQLPSAIDEFRDNNFKNKIEKSKILNDENFSLIFSNYEEIKSLKKEYEQVKLKELVDIKNGYAFKSSDYVEKSSVFNFRMSQIRPNGLIDLEHNPKFLPESYSEKYKDFLINEEDVVIAMTDMASAPKILGLPAVIPKTNFKLLLNQRVGKFIKIDESVILKKYLCYILKSNHLREYYKNLSTGGLQLNLNKENILKIKIPLPSIETQNQIVEELDGYQKVIDGCRQVIENYKPSIDIDPSWEMVEFNVICDVRDGTHDSPKYVDDGYPLITSKNVINGSISFEKVNFISQKDFNDINKRSKVDIGDILMPMIGTIGRPTIVDTDKKFAIKNVALIKTKNNISQEYIRLVLDSKLFENYLISNQAGSTQKFISLGAIRKFKVPVPPKNIEKKIN
jgi:restriction endonuclease S subunit